MNQGDNVFNLFGEKTVPDRLSSEKQKKMLEMVEQLALDVASGNIRSIAIVLFNNHGNFISGTFGQGQYTEYLGGVEDLKLTIYEEHKRQTIATPYK